MQREDEEMNTATAYVRTEEADAVPTTIGVRRVVVVDDLAGAPAVVTDELVIVADTGDDALTAHVARQAVDLTERPARRRPLRANARGAHQPWSAPACDALPATGQPDWAELASLIAACVERGVTVPDWTIERLPSDKYDDVDDDTGETITAVRGLEGWVLTRSDGASWEIVTKFPSKEENNGVLFMTDDERVSPDERYPVVLLSSVTLAMVRALLAG